MSKNFKYTEKKLHSPKFFKMFFQQQLEEQNKQNMKNKIKKKKFTFNKIINFVYWNLIFKIKRFFRSVKLYFMYRFIKKHKYHLVDTKLKPGYYDIDYRMENAIFSLLEEFLTEEMILPGESPINIIDDEVKLLEKECIKSQSEGYEDSITDGFKRKINMWLDVKEAHLWWLENKNKNYSDFKSFDDEQAFEEKKNEILIKIVRNRGILWT